MRRPDVDREIAKLHDYFRSDPSRTREGIRTRLQRASARARAHLSRSGIEDKYGRERSATGASLLPTRFFPAIFSPSLSAAYLTSFSHTRAYVKYRASEAKLGKMRALGETPKMYRRPALALIFNCFPRERVFLMSEK